jgi:hypothetical protein
VLDWSKQAALSLTELDDQRSGGPLSWPRWVRSVAILRTMSPPALEASPDAGAFFDTLA